VLLACASSFLLSFMPTWLILFDTFVTFYVTPISSFRCDTRWPFGLFILALFLRVRTVLLVSCIISIRLDVMLADAGSCITSRADSATFRHKLLSYYLFSLLVTFSTTAISSSKLRYSYYGDIISVLPSDI